MAACAMRMRPSSQGPPPKPPITGMATAFTTAAPASGPELVKSSREAPASSRRFASSTSLAVIDACTGAPVQASMTARLVEEAKRLEEAGASLLDFTNSGPLAGAAVVNAVAIPVIGGFGGGPWLDGRMRMAHAAIGYAASALDVEGERYANVARISFDAISAYAADVRAARQIKGAAASKPAP